MEIIWGGGGGDPKVCAGVGCVWGRPVSVGAGPHAFFSFFWLCPFYLHYRPTFPAALCFGPRQGGGGNRTQFRCL